MKRNILINIFKICSIVILTISCTTNPYKEKIAFIKKQCAVIDNLKDSNSLTVKEDKVNCDSYVVVSIKRYFNKEKLVLIEYTKGNTLGQNIEFIYFDEGAIALVSKKHTEWSAEKVKGKAITGTVSKVKEKQYFIENNQIFFQHEKSFSNRNWEKNDPTSATTPFIKSKNINKQDISIERINRLKNASVKC